LKYYIESAEIRKNELGINDEATQNAIENCKRLAKEIGKENDLAYWFLRKI